MDSTSGSLALSTPLDSLTTKRCQNLPETGIPETDFIFFPKGAGKATFSTPFYAPFSIPRFISIPPLPVCLSIPPPATVSQSNVCICHTQCVRFCPLDIFSISSAMAKSKRSCRPADHDTSATQRAPSRQSPKHPRLWRTGPVLRRRALRRVHKSVPLPGYVCVLNE